MKKFNLDKRVLGNSTYYGILRFLEAHPEGVTKKSLCEFLDISPRCHWYIVRRKLKKNLKSVLRGQ